MQRILTASSSAYTLRSSPSRSPDTLETSSTTAQSRRSTGAWLTGAGASGAGLALGTYLPSTMCPMVGPLTGSRRPPT